MTIGMYWMQRLPAGDKPFQVFPPKSLQFQDAQLQHWHSTCWFQVRAHTRKEKIFSQQRRLPRRGEKPARLPSHPTVTPLFESTKFVAHNILPVTNLNCLQLTIQPVRTGRELLFILNCFLFLGKTVAQVKQQA